MPFVYLHEMIYFKISDCAMFVCTNLLQVSVVLDLEGLIWMGNALSVFTYIFTHIISKVVVDIIELTDVDNAIIVTVVSLHNN